VDSLVINCYYYYYYYCCYCCCCCWHDISVSKVTGYWLGRPEF